ncbi:hypothetical protein PUN28_003184 [Cardiocondyla obscurior]|uniref:Uncharacterized protein n=1 Tax=Cardiocondyla obscurior TaxID=286306 RepID=A0AAW2GJT3_9HYME
MCRGIACTSIAIAPRDPRGTRKDCIYFRRSIRAKARKAGVQLLGRVAMFDSCYDTRGINPSALRFCCHSIRLNKMVENRIKEILKRGAGRNQCPLENPSTTRSAPRRVEISPKRICMLRHRYSGPLRKLSSRQPRHAFRAHSLIPCILAAIESRPAATRRCYEMHAITSALVLNLSVVVSQNIKLIFFNIFFSLLFFFYIKKRSRTYIFGLYRGRRNLVPSISPNLR